MKKRIYIDMDGTIALWQQDKTIEEVATKGYFRDIPVIDSVLSMVKRLIKEGNAEVCILSSVFKDKHSAGDKMHWLHTNLPEMKDENVYFVPYGDKKADYVKLDENSFLLDDLSKNLHEWESAGGVGIKTYNGINGNNGTWKGFSIHSSMDPDRMYRQIVGILGN